VSLWFRIQEFTVEIGLRLAKVLVASLIGAIVYWFLTNIVGAPGSAQLALEAWIAGMIVFVILETGIF
jgi:hypothetical protein